MTPSVIELNYYTYYNIINFNRRIIKNKHIKIQIAEQRGKGLNLNMKLGKKLSDLFKEGKNLSDLLFYFFGFYFFYFLLSYKYILNMA